MEKFFFKTWPILITILVIGLNNRLGVFFIKHFGSFEDVGHYSVIFNLLRFIDFLPIAILTTTFPKIIETRQRDAGQYAYRFSAIYATIIYLVAFMFLGSYLLSDFVIPVLYGDDFRLVTSIFPWGVLATITTYVNLTKAKHFILEGLNREWMIYNILSLLFIFILLYFLTPTYGILGAIFSYNIGYAFSDICLFLFIPKSRSIYKIILYAFSFPYHFFKKNIK